MRGFSFALVRTMESIILSFVLSLYAILPKSQALHRKFTSPTVRLLLDLTSPSALTRCHLPYRGEALAFRKVFLPSSKFSSPPEAPLLGELSSEARLRGCTKESPTFSTQKGRCISAAAFSLRIRRGDDSRIS